MKLEVILSSDDSWAGGLWRKQLRDAAVRLTALHVLVVSSPLPLFFLWL